MELPVFQVHFLGKDPSTSNRLSRPWKIEEQPNPFSDLAKAFNAQDGESDGKGTSREEEKESLKKDGTPGERVPRVADEAYCNKYDNILVSDDNRE